MRELVEFRMHDSEGGMVGLKDVLDLVPDNTWVWSVVDFDGICQAGCGMGYEDLRQKVTSSSQGLVMSWVQVRKFAATLLQCFELLLVAAEERHSLDPERFAAGDFSACKVNINASDSTWWMVEVDSDTEAASIFAASLRACYRGEVG